MFGGLVYGQVQPIPVFGVKATKTLLNSAATSNNIVFPVVDTTAFSTITVTMQVNVNDGACNMSYVLYEYANSSTGPFFIAEVDNKTARLAVGQTSLIYSLNVAGPYARFSFINGNVCNILIAIDLISLPSTVSVSGTITPSTTNIPLSSPHPVIGGLVENASGRQLINGGFLVPGFGSSLNPIGALAVVPMSSTGGVAPDEFATTLTSGEFLVTTAGATQIVTGIPATSKWILITNMGPNPIEIGNCTVTYGTGSPIPANGGERSFDITSGISICAITTAANQIAGAGTRFLIGY